MGSLRFDEVFCREVGGVGICPLVQHRFTSGGFTQQCFKKEQALH